MKKIALCLALLVLQLVAADVYAKDPVLDNAHQVVVEELQKLLNELDAAKTQHAADDKAATEASAAFKNAEALHKGAKATHDDLKKELLAIEKAVEVAKVAFRKRQIDTGDAYNKYQQADLAMPRDAAAVAEAEKKHFDEVAKLCAAKKKVEAAEADVKKINAKYAAALKRDVAKYSGHLASLLKALIGDVKTSTGAAAAEDKALKKLNAAKKVQTAADAKAAGSKLTLQMILEKVRVWNESAGISGIRVDLEGLNLRSSLDGLKSSVTTIGTALEQLPKTADLNGLTTAVNANTAEAKALRDDVKNALAALTTSNAGVGGEVKQLTERIVALSVRKDHADDILPVLVSIGKSVRTNNSEEALQKANDQLTRILQAVEEAAKAKKSGVPLYTYNWQCQRYEPVN